MAQISKGQTFNNGDQVTGTTLNQLVDAATLLNGAITEQTSLSGSVDGADLVLLYDQTATALRKASITDILNSATTANVTTLTTSAIIGQSNSDIVITPNSGTVVTGKAWASVDGILVTVSSTAHGLTTNQILTFTSSNTAFSGVYVITVTSVDLFTYTISPVSTASSGTVSYTKLGVVNINGYEYITSGLIVGGTLTALGNTTFNGVTKFASGITGDTTFNGNVTIGTGKTFTLDTAPTTTLQAATKGYVDSGSKATSKAWVVFAGATGTITNSYNVTSVTRNGVGDYTITFTTAMANNNYCVIGSAKGAGYDNVLSGGTSSATKTTTQLQIATMTIGGTAVSRNDSTEVYVCIFST